jgi:hypothetical protein
VRPAVEEANDWIESTVRAARGGVDPIAATMTLAAYGEAVMSLALRGLELKTLDPYLAGWRRRVVPTLGQLVVRVITNGAVLVFRVLPWRAGRRRGSGCETPARPGASARSGGERVPVHAGLADLEADALIEPAGRLA